MNRKSPSKGAITTGIIAAVAASSCCLPPILAAVAGIGGASSSLTWIEPFRPYLIGLAIVSIGYAWFSHFKSKKEDDCGCEVVQPKFFQTKGFLIGMTLFAAISISFPYYSGVFLIDSPLNQEVIVDKENRTKVTFKIEGMTCSSCENHIVHAVSSTTGIIEVKASYSEGNSEIIYDKTKTSSSYLKALIEQKTAYKIIDEF